MSKIWIVERRKKGSVRPLGTHAIKKKGIKSYKTAEKLAADQFAEQYPKGVENGKKEAEQYDFVYSKELTGKARKAAEAEQEEE